MKDFLFYTPAASGVDWKRIDSLRHVMEKRTASICSQRALLYTQSFQESEGEPYIIRKAKAFAHTLAHMDIYIQPHSLIFGNQASANFAAPIFPEYSIQWVIDELEAFDQRSGDVFQISEEVKQDLKRIAPYWLQRSREFYTAVASPCPETVILFRIMKCCCKEGFVRSSMRRSMP